MLAMSATQNPSVLLQNPLAATAGLSGLGFTAHDVQALQQSLQQQAIQQLALLQQAGVSQFSPQAHFYLQSHVSCLFPVLVVASLSPGTFQTIPFFLLNKMIIYYNVCK